MDQQQQQSQPPSNDDDAVPYPELARAWRAVDAANAGAAVTDTATHRNEADDQLDEADAERFIRELRASNDPWILAALAHAEKKGREERWVPDSPPSEQDRRRAAYVVTALPATLRLAFLREVARQIGYEVARSAVALFAEEQESKR